MKTQNRVNDIPARLWNSFLPIPDYPESPSATASFCSIIAEVGRKWWPQTDDKISPVTTSIVSQSILNQYLITPDSALLRFEMKKGHSVLEPEVSPEQNMYLSYVTWGEFEEECGMSPVSYTHLTLPTKA